MNRNQLIITVVMVAAILLVWFTAPEYLVVPGQGVVTKNSVTYGAYEQQYESGRFGVSKHVAWGTVLVRVVPIVLIGGVLILIFGKKREQGPLPK